MILRDKGDHSSQEKQTSESEENVKIENQKKVLMDQSEVWEKSVHSHKVIQKEEKIENILLSEQPFDLLSCKGTLACTITLAEICELPPQEKTFLKEFVDIFPKDKIELTPFRGIENQIDLVIGANLPNRPAYGTNHDKTKEIESQFREVLEKGCVRKNLSPCVVPILRRDNMLDELHGVHYILQS
ncbi:uncharacterized protein [Phaseolus vulgaris]|uniref:uncharacterized protein n=1 Tax=Phaseolus vulgaris TaxID=3885 RepID=UPI0035C9ED69